MKSLETDQKIANLGIACFFESKDLESNERCVKIAFFSDPE